MGALHGHRHSCKIPYTWSVNKKQTNTRDAQEDLADEYRLITLVVLAEKLKIQTNAFSFV